MTPLVIKGTVETCWHFYQLLPAVLESVSHNLLRVSDKAIEHG